MSHPPDTVDDDFARECARLRNLAALGERMIVTVRYAPLADFSAELERFNLTYGLPPGWVELPPVEPMTADAGDWWPNPAMDDHGDPEPDLDEQWGAPLIERARHELRRT